ncbi:hypothetical protein MKX78_19545 [Cytobacillus sp. FSL R5-0569]|uniref:hypothetical protein n=1 Tax=unclassified Cytobacillus TaxID=2675268 RepID=UPI0030FC04C5
MAKKISKQRFEQIIKEVQEVTRKEFAKGLEEAYGQERIVPLQEFTDEILPKLLSKTFVNANTHAEYMIHDILSELDLLTDDDD